MYSANYKITQNIRDLVCVNEKDDGPLSDNHIITYMDYEIGETVQTPPSSTIGNFNGETSSVHTLSLVTRTTFASTETVDLNLRAEDDPAAVIDKHFADKIFDKIFALSEKNKAEAERHFPTGLDIYLSRLNALQDPARIFISKVMTYSSLIATRTRFGPATFIIMPETFSEYLRPLKPYPNSSIYKPSNIVDMMGIKLFYSERLTDTVLMGRVPQSGQGGLHLFANQSDIEGIFSGDSPDGPDKVTVRYILKEISDSAHRNYLQFSVLD